MASVFARVGPAVYHSIMKIRLAIMKIRLDELH
jgi:hypothetical protein